MVRSLSNSAFDKLDVQLNILYDYMTECRTRVMASQVPASSVFLFALVLHIHSLRKRISVSLLEQVTDVFMETLLRIKHAIFPLPDTLAKGKLKLQNLSTTYHLLCVFVRLFLRCQLLNVSVSWAFGGLTRGAQDAIAEMNRHGPLDDFLLNIFLDQEATFKYLKIYTNQLLLEVRPSAAVQRAYFSRREILLPSAQVGSEEELEKEIPHALRKKYRLRLIKHWRVRSLLL
jgi:hypothetical protein